MTSCWDHGVWQPLLKSSWSTGSGSQAPSRWEPCLCHLFHMIPSTVFIDIEQLCAWLLLDKIKILVIFLSNLFSSLFFLCAVSHALGTIPSTPLLPAAPLAPDSQPSFLSLAFWCSGPVSLGLLCLLHDCSISLPFSDLSAHRPLERICYIKFTPNMLVFEWRTEPKP